MAGIMGAAAPGQRRAVERGLAKLEHRGGAGRSVRALDGATFGEVWPPAQAQYAVGVKRVAVALDGEIHNWTEVGPGTTCPMEALAAAYRRMGPGFVKLLDGPFALAISGPEGIFLARDVVGKSPLYWGRRGDTIWFASEAKALLSLAEDIAIFPPGHYYHREHGLVGFAGLAPREPIHLPERQVADQLRARLVQSVRKRMGGGEVGAWLSGGLDSATMAALARRQRPRLETFVVGIEGSPDVRYARVVADFIGANHHERLCSLEEMLAALPEVIYHLESFDALLIRSSVMNFLVGRLASDHVPAVLSGEGGDELFAGYSYLKDMPLEDLPDELVDITGRLHNTALQRVDRCSASHGLVARTAFLDRDVVDYALRIPPEMKLHPGDQQVEKWILRRAMDGLLPDEVLSRPKAKFWEGSGVADLLASHAEEVISDAEFEAERRVAPHVVLNTKEELFYYRIFQEQFSDSLSPALVGRTKGAPVTP